MRLPPAYFWLFCFQSLTLPCLSSTGLPYIQTFTLQDFEADDYAISPQIWSIIQDDQGLIYICNNSCVLQFDGISWRLVDGTDTIIPIGMAKTRDGVFVGGVNNFGYLAPDARGKTKYYSLLDHVSPEDLEFGKIWQTFSTESAVYFMGLHKLFRWQNNSMTRWKAKKADEKDANIFFPANAVGNSIYIYQTKYGLYRLSDNDSLQLLIGIDHFNGAWPLKILPFQNGLMFASRSNGLIKYENEQLTPLTTPVDRSLKKDLVYSGLFMPAKSIATGTEGGGLYLFDANARLISSINKSSGLYDNKIFSMMLDRENGLWVTSPKCISRIEAFSPLTYFSNATDELSDIVVDIQQYEGLIYCATQEGVFVLRQATDPTGKNYFENLINTNATWLGLVDGKLLALSNDGIFQISRQKITNILEQQTYWIHQMKADPEMILASTDAGLEHLTFDKAGRLTQERVLIELSHQGLNNMAETNTGDIWAGTTDKGVIHITGIQHPNVSIEYNFYHTEAGLPKSDWYEPTNINRRIYFGSQNGLYRFDPQTHKFFPDSIFGPYFAHHEAGNLTQDPQGYFWISSEKKAGKLIKTSAGKYIWDYRQSLRIPKADIYTIFAGNDSVVWYGSVDGIVRYDAKIRESRSLDFQAMIRKVYLHKDSILFWGTYVDTYGNMADSQPTHMKPTLKYADNSITFECAAPAFEKVDAIKFRYWLEGYDTIWSNWSNQSVKEYTNLYEGKYVFKVQAMDVYETKSKIGTYEFVVTPPIYRSNLAYTTYVLLAIGFFIGGIRLNSKRLRAANLRLQQRIRAATAEITKKNEDITSSIRYAKRIQDAILPDRQLITSFLPETFVYFNPRDIVSGDFYWFGEKDDKLIITAADCTGHGVPGAFVSMIGNTMLNKVIHEMGITDPGKILSQLHREIKTALKQDDQGTGSKDGMDIALCVIDKNNRKLQFAGAYNPLYILRQNGIEVEEIKPNKFPVAGFHFKSERIFTSREVPLETGDTFYIFTDGYTDQFGGESDRKFTHKQFRELLLRIQNHDMPTQQKILEETMDQWKGKRKQLDDMLVIGFRFSVNRNN